MHFRAITRIVGLLVILFSGTMIIPGLVALIYRDGAGRAFTQTFFVALAIGAVTPGRLISQASATCAGFTLCFSATLSSACRIA